MTPLMGERVPVIEREYMTVSTEINQEGYTFVHCDVYEWSGNVYKQMLEDWLDWLCCGGNKFLDNVLMIIVEKNNKKVVKFAEMFGFEYLQTHDDMYVVYIMEVA